MRPQRRQHLGERVGLVGVVDEHRRAGGVAADPLEPAGGTLEPAEQRGGGLGIRAGGDHEAERRQQVLRLEGADERRSDRMRAAVERELEPLAVGRGPALDQAQALRPRAIVEHRDAARAADRGERRELRLIGIEHGRPLGRAAAR